ncbi:Clp protease N-terminal domain-containing protein [Streptomyces sp. NBC_01304]|uniref:Clp protease N-terminal domain-containing protein n=1 Tax=Streptomyces sp. NBC_01304 TaxID=2903818 RepID=UPI002E11BE8A|nr:Clp protease N-terminal domain-containing protein [Streptomyces sp. NBC_01304]
MPDDRTPVPATPVPTPRYERVVAEASRIAADLGHGYVGVEHLFLAILRDPDSVPTQVLAEIIALADLDARLSEVMRTYGD